jgi:thiosulfate/3-mercaptopyruvate sulfurtransferase
VKRIVVALTASAVVASVAWGDAVQAEILDDRQGTIVSCDWLESELESGVVKVIDVRTATEYAAGHIEGSVNLPLEVPESAWVTTRDELTMELPAIADLNRVLGTVGVTRESKIVLVTSSAEPPYPQANATRAADTLFYAGVKRVSILDGGYPEWVAQGKAVTTQVPSLTPRLFFALVDHSIFVDVNYVNAKIGRSLIIDARDAAVYSGQVVEPWAEKAGHIPSAVSLPAPLIWNADGTYKSKTELRNIVTAAIGDRDKDDEIIVYCGVGGYASSWWFVLSTVLGFKNVKFYDGAAQEWVRYHDMVM